MKQLKKLLVLSGILILIAFSGCTRTVYVDRVVKVNVPVPCKVGATDCVVSGSDAEVVIGLTKCIIDMKQSIKACQ